MGKNKNHSYLSDLELEQVMYSYSVLVEEMEHARKYFLDHVYEIDEKDLFICSQSDSDQTIVRHIGYLGYFEKEAGKKLEIAFSYRMDVYDQIFCDLSDFVENKEIPSKENLIQFLEEIHNTFMDDLKFIKKSELLYTIINLHYAQAHEIRSLLKAKKQSLPDVQISSKTVLFRTQNHEKLYYLPMYTN
ncbi:MAG: hypothetical protein COB02_02825 [Candidatus Cloacimonadota bacterium]|nr:MAG: hypothetical protein COB02_02825 [Candidatus Cloacimonadota bacterium]